MKLSFKATILAVIFYNESNGYTIIKIRINKDDFKELKREFDSDEITAIGYFISKPSIDDTLEITGTTLINPKFGKQVKIESFTFSDANNMRALIKYLSSDNFEGIGFATAFKIVDKLGLDCLDKIKTDPSCLDEVGLTLKQKNAVSNGVNKDKLRSEALLILTKNGFTLDMASKILTSYNSLSTNQMDVIELIKVNPYDMIKIVDHLGFDKVDAFALNIGIKRDSLIRITALIKYLITENLVSTGNSYLTKAELIKLIDKTIKDIEIDEAQIQKALNNLINSQDIYIDKTVDSELIFDYYLYLKENYVASTITKLISNSKVSGMDEATIDLNYERIAKINKITYNERQEEAIKECFKNPISIITGGPGTGKTTIIKAVCDLY